MTSARTLAAVALALGLAAAQRGAAQTVNMPELFAKQTRTSLPSGEEVLRRALDNLFGFDATISIVSERREANGQLTTTEFLVQRKRTQGARRMLVVSVRPQAVRGTRVLQIDYDDGREETYAFVQSIGGEPMRTRFRLAEPFLGTWHEIGADETPTELLALGDQEVLGFEPRELDGEPVYKITLRPLAGRGYDRSELLIARSDFAILEYRHYLSRGRTPSLIALAPRNSMTRFGDRLVPERLRYRDLADRAEIDVQVRHTRLPEENDALFFPRTFHRFPLAILEGSVTP